MILRSLVIDLPSVYSEGLSEMLPCRNSRAHSTDPDRQGDTGGQIKGGNYQTASQLVELTIVTRSTSFESMEEWREGGKYLGGDDN